MTGPLSGKVAIVTGAASGIGAVAAALFAREGGAHVIALDLPGRDWEDPGLAAARKTGMIERAEADVTNRAQIETVVRNGVDRYGRIDILFNNAGITLAKPLEETTDAEYDLCMDVNVRGVFIGCREVLPIMKRQRSGVIISTASNAGTTGRPHLPVYGAAKGAVVQMSRALAQSEAGYGIRVNCICPGGVDTPMLPDPEAARESAYQNNPLRRLARPEEIARAALFLASDEASYITGVALAVDGGWTAGVREASAVIAAVRPEDA